MVKYFFFVLIMVIATYCETLEVVADRFMADNQKNMSVIEGNVDIKKGQDRLKATKVTIFTDKKNKLKRIFAEGGVDFFINTPDGRKIKGKSKTLQYDAIKQEYHLIGNAVAQEEKKDNSINGDEIIINNQTGYINVVGNRNKPARLIFNLDEVKKEKNKSKVQ